MQNLSNGVQRHQQRGYLSTSGGAWRVICQGLPVCADKRTRAEAQAAAVTSSITLTGVWDGDLCQFIEGTHP